jgi:hypothetical protein
MSGKSGKALQFGRYLLFKEAGISTVVAVTGLPRHESNRVNIAYACAVDGENVYLPTIPINIQVDFRYEKFAD